MQIDRVAALVDAAVVNGSMREKGQPRADNVQLQRREEACGCVSGASPQFVLKSFLSLSNDWVLELVKGAQLWSTFAKEK